MRPNIRELTAHRVNGLNEALRIFVLDKPGSGGACHDYVVLIPYGEPEPDSEDPVIRKQHKEWEDVVALLDSNEEDGPSRTEFDINEETTLTILDDFNFAKIPIMGSLGFKVKTPFKVQRITFQNGPVKEAGYNGNSHEALLAILIDRLEGFMKGEFSCRDNAVALNHLDTARLWLHKRTMDRVARGVEGTHKK
jgi:hypothetical protein